MTPQEIATYAILTLIVIVVIFALFKINETIKIINSVINDTLKKPDDKGVWRFTRTSLTMFTAWVLSIYMALFDLYKNGFHLEVFMVLVGVALGSKVVDGYSKKLTGDVKPTSSDTPVVE